MEVLTIRPTAEYRVDTYGKSFEAPLAVVLNAGGLLHSDNSDVGAFWRDVVYKPFVGTCEVLVAHTVEDVLGVGVALRRPYGREEGRLSLIWVAPEHRRQGIGRALKEAIDDRLRARGIGVNYFTLSRSSEPALAFLEATGFQLVSDDLILGWKGAPYHYTPVEGVRCEIYCGGDPELNARIAELHNRSYTREPLVPHFTAETVAYVLRVEQAWMVVAIEERTGEVVGCSECTDTTTFYGIAVARRYWGKGLAEWIAGLSMDRYVAAGVTNIWSLVRRANHASLALHARMQWHPAGEVKTFGCRLE